MKRRNYESDFVAKMTLPQGIEGRDFEMEFATSGLARYVVSRIAGVHKNCVTNADGSVTVVFDNHQLGVGMLRYKYISLIANSAMPDGVQKTVTPKMADVELVAGPGDDDNSEISFAIAVDYAVVDAYDMAVKAGYKGTREEYVEMISAKDERVGNLVEEMIDVWDKLSETVAKSDGVLQIVVSAPTTVTLDGRVVELSTAGEHEIVCRKESVISDIGANVIGICRFDGVIVCPIKNRNDVVFINNTTIEVANMTWFYECANLEKMDNTTIICRDNVVSMYGLFRGTRLHSAPSMLNTVVNTGIADMYAKCQNLVSVPFINTSNVTSFQLLFEGCFNLASAPLYDTSQATNINGMFRECQSLRSLPEYNFANVTSIVATFCLMSNLVEFPGYFNFSKVVTATYAFCGDWGYYKEQADTFDAGGLRRFPAYSFPECTDLMGAWQDQSKLFSIGKLNVPKCLNFDMAFHGCFNLTNVGGFTGLKCNINMAHCKKLTVASMLNIFNEAVDVTEIGVRTMVLGEVNLAKLSDAQKAIATAKGWTLS